MNPKLLGENVTRSYALENVGTSCCDTPFICIHELEQSIFYPGCDDSLAAVTHQLCRTGTSVTVGASPGQSRIK